MSFVLWCRTFCGWLNGSWLCLHGFAIWQQKGKNGAGERFVLEIRTRPSELMAARSWLSHSGHQKSSIYHNIYVRYVNQRNGETPWIMKCCLCLDGPGPRSAHQFRQNICPLSIKGKLANMTCWIVCFNRRGQLQRLVVFFFELWQVASTPGVPTAE